MTPILLERCWEAREEQRKSNFARLDREFRLTFLILGLNRLVDKGNSLTLDEVHEHIECGDVIEWLDKRFAGSIDLSIYHGRLEAKEIAEGLQAIQASYLRSWGECREVLRPNSPYKSTPARI
jgi:hypothetical protein